MQGLAIDVGGGSPGEGGEDDVGAAGVVAWLLEDAGHHCVQGVDQPRLATAGATVHNDQGGRGSFRSLKVRVCRGRLLLIWQGRVGVGRLS